MPDFPDPGDAPRKNVRNFTINFLAVGGDTASTSLNEIPVSVSGAELANVRTALGNMSNAAIVSTYQSEVVSIALTNATPLDEAWASPGDKLLLVFQDDDQETKSFAVPAPDASYFGSDGVGLITPNGAAAAGTPARVLADAITAITLALNGGAAADPAGTYAFLRGYRSRQARRIPRPRYSPTIVEPTTEEPGPEPGV